MGKHNNLWLFIDIDGTLVGDVSKFIFEYEILFKYEKAKLPAFRKHLIHHLENKLLRPDFSTFVTYIQQSYEDVKLFIYTASEDKWAKFLVNCIETMTKVKFQRPLYTRKDCHKVYGSTKNVGNLLNKLNPPSKCMVKLIDNNFVLNSDEVAKGYLIKCPTYHYEPLFDVFDRISRETLESHDKQIIQRAHVYNIISVKAETILELLGHFYLKYGKQLLRHPSIETPDTYWKSHNFAKYLK